VTIFPVALWPWVDSVSNRNEYQVYFLGGKGSRCIRPTTLPPSCAVVMKSGNLNFLEPSGPFQACNGTAALHGTYLIPLKRYALFPQSPQRYCIMRSYVPWQDPFPSLTKFHNYTVPIIIRLSQILMLVILESLWLTTAKWKCYS